ncbi:hypothetical protein WN944_022917 [Citrus x changshan-huyou]|uniref:Uncharacterized protein n=1 Tax=Citrus x changshan-huyou TaxID=2935761 RepID=A0AAP0R3G3_9ROSI
MRSGPSPGPQSRAFFLHHQYSWRVSPFQAKMEAESRAMAAAAWSWVEKMLQEHQRTSAPRARHQARDSNSDPENEGGLTRSQEEENTGGQRMGEAGNPKKSEKCGQKLIQPGGVDIVFQTSGGEAGKTCTNEKEDERGAGQRKNGKKENKIVHNPNDKEAQLEKKHNTNPT